LIVFAHEFGHYYAAKKVGVKITTFSLGMGPEIFGFTDRSGTRWSFSLLPIGGYVMMLGDGDISSTVEDKESIDKLSEEEKKQSICTKNNFEKMLIAFSGPLMNYVYSFVVIAVMAFSYGVPKYSTNIGSVIEKSPAEKAGLLAGDKILSVNGKNVIKYREVAIAISEAKDREINFSIERNGEQISITVTPEITEKKSLIGKAKKSKVVGIKSEMPKFERLSILDSIKRAFCECVSATKEMAFMLSRLFAGKKSLDDLGGVVHMASIAGDLSKEGSFALLIIFTATLSLNLGFINLFPLPVLDGGRILICFIEQVINRKLNQKIQEYIMTLCAGLLILLMLVITANDVLRMESVNNFVTQVMSR
jgi:regulator of sigma E protease